MILLTVLLLAAAAPSADAARAHAAGMQLADGHPPRLRAALPLLEQAVKLEPNNAGFLGDLAGTCFQIADAEKSYFMATRGRDLMEKTVRLDPKDLKARDGLMQFYSMAPWPLGNADRAEQEAAEIARQDPRLGVEEELKLAGIFAQKGKKERAQACLRAADALRRP